MEYSDLKTIWKLTTDRQSFGYQMSREDVDLAIRRKSSTVISKIRARLKLKILIQTTMGILGLVFSAYAFQNGMKEIAVMQALLFSTILMLGLHKILNYTRIVTFQKSSDPLKTSLIRITNIMNKVVHAQIYTTVTLATLAVVLVAIFRLNVDQHLLFRVFTVTAAAIVASILFYFVAKRGQKKMFGNYIEMLKDCSNELEMAEEHSGADEEN